MTSFNKKILILGATSQTIPFVIKARNKGLITFVADNIENSPAKKYADFPLLIDCFNIDDLEKTVIKNKIDGVIVGCADTLLPCYLELCKRTGLPCYATKELISIFCNKKGLKDALRKYNLPFIPEYSLDKVLNNDISKENYPLLIKPVDNCSSKGMSVCYDNKEFNVCYNKAINYSKTKTILIEKVMKCDDISITYTFINGRVYVMSISDRYVNREQEGLGTITSALVYPSIYTNLYFETVHDRVCEMFQKLKIKDGVLTIQAFVENNKIMFYDPAFRTTGGQGYIFYDYFKSIDQIDMLLNFAIFGKMANDDTIIKNECNFGKYYAINLVLLIKTGKIGIIRGIEKITAISGVLNFTQCHFVGDYVKGKGTLDQTFARLHIIADSIEKLKMIISEVYNNIIVKNEYGDNMFMKQFNIDELNRYY